MNVIIAEKPSVAKDLARVLEATKRADGYFFGQDNFVTWAFGHMVELAMMDAYDPKYKRWTIGDLPMIPDRFKTKIRDDDGIKKQIATIKDLLDKEEVTTVICATDAGREGELIFRFIYKYLKCKKPIKRLWISSMTDKAIQDGFAALKDGAEYQPLYDSALSRSEADWLVGLNATRSYTCKFSNGHGVLSVGRVQTPVLKMIVDRHKENSDFKHSLFYEIVVNLDHENGQFEAKRIDSLEKKETRILDKAEASQVLVEIQEHDTGVIQSAEGKDKSEKQPLLYDLTSLQKDANRWYKLSADETLNAMQNLYQTHKLLTYPRTNSNYLTSDMAPALPVLIENLKQLPAYQPFATAITAAKLNISKRIIDDKKVDDHHAIIPTDKSVSEKIILGLAPAEQKIYDMVIRRFLAAFYPECKKRSTEIITAVGQHLLLSKGMVTLAPGWREVYQNPEMKDDSDENEEMALPIVKEGDQAKIAKATLKEGKTKAPPLHTESSILSLMETAGKHIDDEELREALKDCGLGTPATRAAILETLIKRQFVDRLKNKLVPTEKGIWLISLIADESLLSPELTGHWEKKLNEIVKGKYSRKQFMTEIRDFTNKIVDNVKTQKSALVKKDHKVPVVGKCPACETGDVLELEKLYGCSNYRSDGCSFMVWKNIASRPIELECVTTLLEHKKTDMLKGFQSKKTGKAFDARLMIVDQKVVLGFE